MQLHGSLPERLQTRGWLLYKLFTRWLVGLCDGVLLLSSEECNQWRQLFPKQRFWLVTNPFDPEAPGESQTEPGMLAIPDDRVVLLFVGRLIAVKGIFDLIEAVSRLPQATAWHLLVAGSGPEAEQVGARVRELGIEDRVTLAGYLPGAALATAYERAAIFVLPTFWAEGFPTVISEAMGAGLPVVTTRLRGVADHLQDNVHAVFVPAREPAALAAALADLLADPVKRAAMSQANRQKVKDFAPDLVAAQYLDVLREALGQP